MKTKDLQIVSLFLLLGLLCLLGCQSNQVTKHTPTKQKTGFISNKQATEDATYQGIQSNVARLHAMLTGSFIQYSNLTPKETPNEYSVWKVNDGKDSVMLYSIPIGDPNKIGYWIYHYQTMTSLPDEPIYELFEELTEINRDTIKSVFYEAPKSFNVPLETLYKEHKNAFKSLNMDSIRAGTVSKKGVYIRQNPLFFTRTTPVIALPKMEDGSQYYYRDSFATQSLGLGQQFDFFQDEKEQFRLTGYRYKYVKLATVR